MNYKVVFILPFLLSTFLSLAQNVEEFTIKVMDDNGNELINPFSGGYDTPQFSEADFNNDGQLDLFVFDFTGEVVSTYLNTGTAYVYAPSYAKTFPELNYIAILRDYDGDGAMDLFTYKGDDALEGYTVYKGFFNTENQLGFIELNFNNPEDNLIPYYDMDGNLSTLSIDETIYPIIDDMDNDGDVDIVSIPANGGYFEFYQNLSVENGWGLDSLYFVYPTECYGGALESGGDLSLDLANSPGECFPLLMGLNVGNNSIHGGYSLLSFDNDGDGDRDILFGDKQFNNMNLLTNGGDTNQAFFTEQDTIFPNYSIPIEADILPAAFYIDTDFDGVRDLVVSSRISNLQTDAYAIQYKNNGTNDAPSFDWMESDWLTVSSIDYGKLSHPSLVDYNQDGLMDLIISGQIIRLDDSQFSSSLSVFENTGTLTEPEFTLVEVDWLGTSSLGSQWLRPTYGDLDNDGDTDMLIGDATGQLIYFENSAGAGNIFSFEPPIVGYMGIDIDFSIGSTASPQLIDMNDDDLLDIIVGMRQGNIVYFENEGVSGNPLFNPDPSSGNNQLQLGNVSVGISGSPVPFILEVDGAKTLYVGDLEGEIWVFDNIDDNLNGDFNLVANGWGDIRVGEFASPWFEDINRDGNVDLFIGNFRGGTNLFTTDIYVGNEIVSINDIQEQKTITFFPNPSQGNFDFNIDEDWKTILIYDVNGRLLIRDTKDITTLPNGVYWVEVITNSTVYKGKIVKS